MGFFGILILIGIFGFIFCGIGGGFWHRRRYGHFRPFGFGGHRPPPPRGPGGFERGPGGHGGFDRRGPGGHGGHGGPRGPGMPM